ncbi:MAG: hypothetical protein R6V27_04395 [Balneolaceae bacterium]
MNNLAALGQNLSSEPSKCKKTDLFIAGIGAVGQTLIRQLRSLDQSDSFNILGVCNSKRTLWLNGHSSPIDKKTVSAGEPKKWGAIFDKLAPAYDRNLVFIDATGDQEVAELYLKLLNKGIHLVTPSKIANTRKQIYFELLQKTADKNDVHFLYETNVGAGLPVIRTVRDLVSSGDSIIEISGVLSGTMSYIFSQLDEGHSFSEVVLRARQLGYAEPDPRDDLSGEDVARKMMILSRVSGHHVERDELDVESVTPEWMESLNSASFLKRLPEVDTMWKERLNRLREKGKTLRYTGVLNSDGIRVGLQEVDKDSPLGRLNGTNNLIQIKSERYSDQPMIIQGPGAGKEVTAAGVLSDILKIAHG